MLTTVVWKGVLFHLNQVSFCFSWSHEAEFTVCVYGGRSLRARLRRVAMAVAVYYLWQKRNKRIFATKCCIKSVVIRDIENYVKAKANNWRVKRKFNNWCCCKGWGLDE